MITSTSFFTENMAIKIGNKSFLASEILEFGPQPSWCNNTLHHAHTLEDNPNPANSKA